MVLVGARRSSPGIREVQEEELRGWEEEEEPMLPVKGCWDAL